MTKRTLAALTAALLVPAVFLAGCGANPTAAKRTKARPAPMNQFQGGPQMMGQMPMQPGQQAPEVAQMLAALRQAQQQIPGFTATVETYDKGPSGQESTTMKVAYKKPSTLRIEMTKASGQAQGAKILWTGGTSLRIKPSFLPMTVEKSISDEMVKSKNGWTLRDTEVGAIFKVLFDPQAQIAPKGMQNVDGRQLHLFEVRSPMSPKGTTHEAIGIDPTNGLPGVRMMFKGQTLIYKLTLKNMVVKPPSASELEV